MSCCKVAAPFISIPTSPFHIFWVLIDNLKVPTYLLVILVYHLTEGIRSSLFTDTGAIWAILVLGSTVAGQKTPIVVIHKTLLPRSMWTLYITRLWLTLRCMANFSSFGHYI